MVNANKVNQQQRNIYNFDLDTNYDSSHGFCIKYGCLVKSMINYGRC